MKKGSDTSSSSMARNQRGIELADRGWLEEALREFSRAIEEDPATPYPWLNRANVYLQQGRYTEALSDIMEALKRGPEDSATHFHLGSSLYRFGPEIARSELQKALELDPENLDAMIHLAMLEADSGDLESAERLLLRAYELDPDDPVVQRELGALMLDQARPHQAIVYLRNAFEAWPEDTDTALDLAAAYIQAGFYQQADRLLKKIVAGQPNCVHAWYNLAAIHADWGRQSRCRSYLRQALEIERRLVLKWLETDSMFDKVRDSWWFKQLVGRNE
ncbi:MAG: tetratricopeptide repeat protein [Deltaproteobacteria bacterium]|nr:MAG: tetratricopeptide repeat protein [Deltaproteobacteria bacterium]